MGRHRIALLPLAVLLLTHHAVGADPQEEPPMLLGVVTAAHLDAEPYAEWSRPGYDEYVPDAATLDRLRGFRLDGLELWLVFGTWCGDSRREVPRILKLLDALDFPADRVRLIAVDRSDELHKRAPGGEEAGLEVYRVPTLVVKRDGRELSRIVEHPARSLERDLAAILADEAYTPSYRSYPAVRRWLAEGLLADPNVSPWGLAAEVRHAIASEGELAAAARVLHSRGQLAEAIKLYEVNHALHRDSADACARLARALVDAGDLAEARRWAERAVRLNEDPARSAELVELLAGTFP